MIQSESRTSLLEYFQTLPDPQVESNVVGTSAQTSLSNVAGWDEAFLVRILTS